MASPAFLKMGIGAFGTAPFGTAPFGGITLSPYTVPTAQPGSDRLDASERRQFGEIIHERDGLIVGIISRGSRRRWRQIWKAITPEDATALLEYANLRRFYVLPTGDVTGGQIAVYWEGAEAAAQTLRAGYRTIEAELVELTGPAAAEY